VGKGVDDENAGKKTKGGLYNINVVDIMLSGVGIRSCVRSLLPTYSPSNGENKKIHIG